MSADPGRDAHLLAALRHAPDHDAAPPAALSARILEQARQAEQPPRPAPLRDSGLFERWFGWTARPLAAGAFGLVLIAGFVGLMWREGPPPEALSGDPPVAPAATAVPPAPAPTAASAAPAPAAEPITESALREQAGAAKTAAPRAVAPAPPTRRNTASAERRAEAVADSVARPVEQAAPAAPAAQAAPERLSAPALPPPSVAGAVAEPPAVTPRAPAPAAAPMSTAARKAAVQAGEQSAAAFDPLTPPLLALTGAQDRFWRERLLALRRQLAGPWQAADALPPGAGEEVVDADGRILGRLQVTAAQLTWQGSDGQAWRAPLQGPAAPPNASAPAR